jgi:hypothetical protein
MAARHLVIIVGGRGNFCTGTAIARDLVLTAAHCVQPGADYKLIEFDSLRQPNFRDVALVVTHPQFDIKAMLAHRVSADVALLKLAAPLSPAYTPAPLRGERKPVEVGEKFLLAGFGVGDTRRGLQRRHRARRDPRRHRKARLAATASGRARHQRRTPRPRRLHRRFRRADVLGNRRSVICRGRDQLVDRQQQQRRLRRPHRIPPLARYRGWIVETAGKLP